MFNVLLFSRRVLDGMQHYQVYAGERTRFQGIINDLDKTTGRYREDVSLKVAVYANILCDYLLFNGCDFTERCA